MWTRLWPACLYGLWLPVHTTAFPVHLPSISDEPEPDGNADADDEDAEVDAEVDAEALTKKRSHLPFGKCCYACAALKLACQNFRKPSSSCLSTCFSNHAILWAQCELSFFLHPKEIIISQHSWFQNCFCHLWHYHKRRNSALSFFWSWVSHSFLSIELKHSDASF